MGYALWTLPVRLPMQLVSVPLYCGIPELLSAFNAFILLQGLETLSLRVERHVENALKVVSFLNNHPKVKKVNHPSLADHPDHALYQRYFPNGASSIFTFEIKGGQEEAHRFIDSLEIFSYWPMWLT